MLDVVLLGTSGMMPLPGRWLTSCYLRYNGIGLLIDSGEGTQIAMKEAGLSTHDIDIICYTHFHADHISGLPGLLLSIGNADRTDPVKLIGPKGLERVVNSLRVVAPELPFELQMSELTESVQHLSEQGYEIDAFRLQHKITCYGYSVNIPRLGKFDAERAKELEIPLKFWNKLQHGETMTDGDKTYTPDMVMSAPRKGLKVTYCTDSRPVPVIAEMAAGSDIFICEGMYGDSSRDDKAREYKHMTFTEAAQLAKEAQPAEMWLTHFSPALVRPKDFLKNATKIFPETKIGKCGMSRVLKFVDEEELQK